MKRKNVIERFLRSDEVYTPFIGGYWTPIIRILLAIHLVVYLTQIATMLTLNQDVAANWLAVHGDYHWRGVRLFTSIFVHNIIPAELAFTMSVLALMGGDLQRRWGVVAFLAFYLMTNMVSTSFRMILEPHTVHYGSLAGSLGVFCLFGMSHPRRQVYGIITVRGLLLTSLVVTLLVLASHKTLAEILTYLLAISIGWGAAYGVPRLYRRWMVRRLVQSAQDIYALDQLKDKIDTILDKVAEQGITSLSAAEHQFLQHASEIFQQYFPAKTEAKEKNAKSDI